MNFHLLKTYEPELSCAQCITAGYVFAYDATNADSTSADAGFCCRKKADGTLFCGKDEEMFAYFESTTSIDRARTDKVRVLLDDLATAGLTVQHEQAYTDLYAAYNTNKG